MEPDITEATWPPITRLGVEAMEWGMTKTMNAVEATATTMAAPKTAFSMTRMTRSVTVARAVWNRYWGARAANLLSMSRKRT